MNSGSAAFSPVGEMTVNALYLQKRILQILIIASQKHTNYVAEASEFPLCVLCGNKNTEGVLPILFFPGGLLSFATIAIPIALLIDRALCLHPHLR